MPLHDALPAARQPGQAVASVSARGTVQLMLARGCFMVSGYLISVILARGLGPAEFGTYGVIMSVLVWIEVALNAGIPPATIRLLPQYEHQASAVEQTARMLLLLWSLGLFSLCWIFAPALARFFNISAGTTSFRLAFLDIPFMGMYAAYRGVLSGHRRFGALSVSFIVYSLTKLIGIVLLLVFGLSVAGAFVANVLATVGALGYLVVKFPPTGLLPSRALLRAIIRVAFPLGLYVGTLQVLLQLDLWSLKSLWTGSGEVIGFYLAALNVSRLPSVVPSVVSGVLFASLAQALARADEALAQRYIQGAGRFILVILVPSCVLLILHAEEMMELLYTRMYAPGGTYLRFQIIAFVLLAFLDIYFHALMAAGQYVYSVSMLLCLIPLALLFNVILIPRFGAMGAAMALLLTVCLGATVAVIFAYRRFGPLLRFPTVVRIIVATGLVAFLSTQIPLVGLGFLLKLIMLLGVYALLLGLLKELTWKDLQAFALWRRHTL